MAFHDTLAHDLARELGVDFAPFERVTYESTDAVAIITIAREDKLNALDSATIVELLRAFLLARADSGVRAVVLTGAGAKAFIAGADIAEMAVLSPDEARRFAERGQQLTQLIESMPKPVIAAVNGFALGGGCEVALSCHIRIASENARFGQPEVKLGLLPGFGGSQRLPRLVGKGRALELLLTGGMIDAAESLRIGLVNKVVPAGTAVDVAREMGAVIAANAPLAIEYCMAAVASGMEMPLDEALRMEAALFGLCFASEDMREGTSAFLEKRPARFTGK
jgi:enoyl-CoA hydratase